jgi:hypothetical protein
VRDQIVNLRIRNTGSDTIHSRLSIQCFAQGRGAQLAALPRHENCHSAGIKVIERAFQFLLGSKLHAPPVAQIWRRF